MNTTTQNNAPKHTLPTGYRLQIGADGDTHVISETGWRGFGITILAQNADEDGYLFVRVTENGKRSRRYIHRLVCTAIHGNRPSPKHEVRHKDGYPTNNSASNLCWGTRKENAIDRSAHGRCYRPDWSDPEKRQKWSASMRVPKSVKGGAS